MSTPRAVVVIEDALGILVSSCRVFVMSALLIALAVPVQAQTLYGVVGPDDHGGPSTLYRIDPVTATASPVGVIADVFGNFTSCCQGISALAFHPTTGILYAVSPSLLSGKLIRIDPARAVATEVATISNPGVPVSFGTIFPEFVGDIAFRADGVLFGFFYDSDFVGGALARINISTGVATAVESAGVNYEGNVGRAIAFSPTGALLHNRAGALQTLDQTTGLATSFVPFSFPKFAPSEMEFQPGTGILFASHRLGDLFTIDPATGEVTSVGTVVLADPVTGPFFTAIAFSPLTSNTPLGPNVAVSLPPATLTFDNVTQAGNTALTTSSTGPALPSGFSLGTPPTYFNISTTAVFSGLVQTCIHYTGIAFGSEANLHLLHFDGTSFVDVTISLDTANDLICGRSASLSPFAVVERSQSAAQLIVELIEAIKGHALPPAVEANLVAALNTVLSNPRHVRLACAHIDRFIRRVQSAAGRGQIPAAKATLLIGDARAVKTALGC